MYGMLNALLRLHELDVVEVPMRPFGMNLDALEAGWALRSSRPGPGMDRLLETSHLSLLDTLCTLSS